MRRRAHIVIASAGLAALVVSGCTPVETGTTAPDDDRTTAVSDPAPVVTVVNEALETDSAQAGAEAAAADATASPAAAASDAAGTEAAETDAEDAGSVHIAAGAALELAVEGGVFTEVRLLDADHESVPVDSGAIDDGSADASDDTTDTADTEDTESDGSVSDGATESADETAGADEEATGTSGADEGSGAHWESTADLVTGATYTWEATTQSPDGAEHTTTGTVTTPETTAQEELTAKTVIADDETVGVGAPIVVMFNSTIPEDARAAIESRLSVDVTDEDGDPVEVEGSWGWLYDVDGISRVHYRPQEFWPANVDIDVSLPLEGVEYSPRWYGKEDVELSFEVGRDQRVVADAQTHRMTIERDGEEIADWPTSLGAPQSPSYNGTHVVMAKHEFYTMSSEQWDYETDVSWAVRIHNNGEFVHAAPWSEGAQGSANVSHGCVNLSTERAKEYYDMALYGDPVEITGSAVDLSTEDSDISDWVYSWEDWQELSALN